MLQGMARSGLAWRCLVGQGKALLGVVWYGMDLGVCDVEGV